MLESPLLEGLSEAARSQVVAEARGRRAEKGDVLFRQDDPAEALHVSPTAASS